jgi:ketosteroid isomerase-like protein
MTKDRTSELVRAYYDSWKNGMASYDEARLRAILAADLKFEGPLAGKLTSADAFLPGLARFVQSVKAFHMRQEIHAGHEAAALYDCDLTKPAGTFRFTEFFRVENDKISAITLVFDATEFRKLMAG